MIDLDRLSLQRLRTTPYAWVLIDRLFSARHANALAATFPRDNFKRLADYGGEKDFEYESRALIDMNGTSLSNPGGLSSSWRAFGNTLLSVGYRAALSTLIGQELSSAPLEVNVFHYPPGGSLGPHTDLRDKLVTHVFYFNREWNRDDGGCLTILRTSNADDIDTTILPIVGNSAVLVRSDTSWHAVTPVLESCRLSRRSLTATFYRPGSVSTMWPPGQATPLHSVDFDHAGVGWRDRLDAWWRT